MRNNKCKQKKANTFRKFAKFGNNREFIISARDDIDHVTQQLTY